jgi:hypothetical protein
MIGYPITYGDTLEEGSGFSKVLKYWVNKKNQANFIKGYKFGLLVFGLSVVLLKSTAAFASDSGVRPTNSGADGGGSCSGTGSPASEAPKKPGGLANVPTADRGAYGASALGICGIAMKSGAYWIGFVCAAAVIIGVRMAAVPANN